MSARRDHLNDRQHRLFAEAQRAKLAAYTAHGLAKPRLFNRFDTLRRLAKRASIAYLKQSLREIRSRAG